MWGSSVSRQTVGCHILDKSQNKLFEVMGIFFKVENFPRVKYARFNKIQKNSLVYFHVRGIFNAEKLSTVCSNEKQHKNSPTLILFNAPVRKFS
jgi:hypothetical protein